MVRYSSSPQFLIALAASVALVTTAPFVQAQLAEAQGDIYVLQIQNEQPIELRADRITRHQNGFVTLERNDKTVAILGSYQVMYVVRKADRAANLYEAKSHDGTTARFRADNIRLDPQGFVELTVDGKLSGIVWNQIRYLKLVEVDN
ncbi:MAG: hypothetical protein IH968_08470 [Gemmatimonadetes bacterium]|nr:hypothetical protein [Gemmatimonadota bacterium]